MRTRIETDDPLAYYRRRNEVLEQAINQNYKKSARLSMKIVQVPMSEKDRALFEGK